MLTDDHKTKRMGSALKFLMCYALEGDEFLGSLWLEMKNGVFTTLLNPSNRHCNGAICIPPKPKKLAALCIGAAISNTSHSNKAGSTTLKRARLTGKGSRSTTVLPQ